MKHHPYFRDLLSGNSTRIAYGGRTLNEGGLQSIPKLFFPGGALIGCSAGFVNVAKIKGTHNAMKSGMLAAEAAYDAVASQDSSSTSTSTSVADMSKYEQALRQSWVWSDLHEVRNVRPSFNTPLGRWGGIVYSGIDTLFLKGRTPWTFRSATESDAAHTGKATQFEPIAYPPFEPPLSTDLLTSLALTGTNHAEDQPVHLRVRESQSAGGGAGVGAGAEGRKESGGISRKEGEVWVEDEEVRRNHVKVNVGEYAGLLGRACPAQVYEYVDDEASSGDGWGGKKLVINSQVCLTLMDQGARVDSILIHLIFSQCRTASTASYVISKSRHKTSPGQCLKAEADRNTVSENQTFYSKKLILRLPYSYHLNFVVPIHAVKILTSALPFQHDNALPNDLHMRSELTT